MAATFNGMSAGSGSNEYRGSRRRDTRVALEARAHGRTCSLRLYDISVTGCRIDCAPLDLSVDDRVTFTFAEAVRIDGTIAWRRGEIAGVRFTKPLPDTIARHLRTEPDDTDQE